MEEIVIETIKWIAPEHKHKEKSMDFFWTVGIIALLIFVASIWFQNYLFAIFILISSILLIMISNKTPEDIEYKIDTEGISIRDKKYRWKEIKGYFIKKYENEANLLIEIDKYFLPIYTIPVPLELTKKINENLKKILNQKDLNESQSMIFMEKIGF